MVKVIEYLNEHGIDKLQSEFHIEVNPHDIYPLYILNYTIDSPKTHPITMECRGLIVERDIYEDKWSVYARSFLRFFNFGEAQEITDKFDWTNFTCYEKCDGSLVTLFYNHYEKSWNVTTRGSWANKPIQPGCPTWSELIWNLIDEVGLDYLDKNLSYVFELCSRYNKVVRDYPQPKLFLLNAVHINGVEAIPTLLDHVANLLKVERPKAYDFKNLTDIKNFVDRIDDATFEGLVSRDIHGLRIKIKNARYVALHALKGNNNIFLVKNLFSFLVGPEEKAAELLIYFPELRSKYEKLNAALKEQKSSLLALWNKVKWIENQKDFALSILKKHRFANLLFEVRKNNRSFDEIWASASKPIIAYLEEINNDETQHSTAA